MELERILDLGISDWPGEVQIRHALAKEYEDLADYTMSWSHLVKGAHCRRRHMRYDVSTDVDTVQWIIDAFPAAPPQPLTGCSSNEPIFIVGLPRSGSTLVKRILSSHSGVCAAGELNHFAQAIVHAVRVQAGPGSLGRAELVARSAKVDFTALGRDYLDRSRPTIRRMARFTDKMPLNYLYCGLIHRALPSSRIVHVLRRPMAACYAIFKTLFKDGYPFSYDLEELGHYYVGYRRLMDHWTATMPGVIHVVSYERLVGDLHGETGRLLDFCGLAWEGACLDFHLNPVPTTTASAVQVRQPLYDSSIDQWRRQHLAQRHQGKHVWDSGASAVACPSMTETPKIFRRHGPSRDARRAMRAGPLPDHLRPVRPGMHGGRYRPLSDDDVLRIHRAALRLLAEVGLAGAPPSGIEILLRAGCIQSDEGRILFPQALVEQTLAMAGRHFVLHGQARQHDMEPWGTKVYFGTAGAAVTMVDAHGVYRESTVKDLYDIGRIVDAMEHIHFFQRAVVPRDLSDPYEVDLNTCYASVCATTKHIGSSWAMPEHVNRSLEMLHVIAGGEDKWRERPFVSQSNCFVVPPMKFATDACCCMEAAVAGGMPILLLSAGQAGATAPAALAGALSQEVAEVLAGLVYVNSIKPGHPAIFGTWCFVSDLRTGAMSGGSPEQALLSAASAQMAQFYDLTGGTASGMTDSKLPDAQSGAEKGYGHALVGNAGANLIYEAAGMHASLLGFSLESLLIDNDIIGAAQRTIRGIEVNDDSLSFETIREVCLGGPGHYLGSDQTLRLMQSAFLYPAMGDRLSPNEWTERGAADITQRAAAKVREILSTHFPSHIPESIDAAMRERFPIRLARAAMRPPTESKL